MMFQKELLAELESRSGIKSRIADEEKALPFEGFSPVTFTKKSFLSLKENRSSSSLSVLAVDGGNSPILEGESFTLDFVRVSYCIFSEERVKKAETYSGFILAYLDRFSEEKDELIIKAAIFDSTGLSGFSEECYEFSFEGGTSQVSSQLRESVNNIRRSMELSLCIQQAARINNAVLLLDGSLYEKESAGLINELYALSVSNSLKVFGISKTSSIFTRSGKHLGSLLMADSPKGEWAVLIAKSKPAPCIDVFFARLNKSSGLCFRIDTFSESAGSLTALLPLSKHSAFLGYPYPLIVADRNARVKNQDKHFLSTYLKRAVNDKQLETVESILRAHDFLDKIG
ncbi:MAG TPA: DNA double-strand break repair nuclease NurA [Candidatus Woesearchaeota archaeon]|nr:DNA double-strand break repair nuclease NurA [Candidatus Woesearchaeota archaeon]